MTKTNAVNFFTDYLIIILCIALPSALYFSFWSVTGSSNPVNWSKAAQIHFVVYAIILPLALFTCYKLSNSEIDAEKWLHASIELKEYKDKKFLDLIFTHYTNVATIGLFWMVIIFTLRPLVDKFSGLTIGMLLGTIMIPIFIFYSLLFIKTGLRLALYSKKTYFLVGTILFIIDSQAIRLFMESVPKVVT